MSESLHQPEIPPQGRAALETEYASCSLALLTISERIESMPAGQPDAALAAERAAYLAKEASIVQSLETFAPEINAELYERAGQIERTVDYDRLVALIAPLDADSDHAGMLHKVREAVGIRRFLNSGEAFTYQEALQLLSLLDNNYAILQRQGLTLEQPQEEGQSELEERWMQMHSERVLQLAHRYIRDDEQPRHMAIVVANMTSGTTTVPTAQDIFAGRIDCSNNALVRAAARYMQGAISSSELVGEIGLDISSQAFKDATSELRRITPEEGVRDVKIDVLDDLPFEFERDAIRTFVAKYVPPTAALATKRIVFRALTDRESGQSERTGAATKYNSELNGYEIIVSVPHTHADYEQALTLAENAGAEPASIEETARRATAVRMFEAILHEYAHVLHRVMPMALLHEWDTACEHDAGTHANNHVRQMYDEGDPRAYSEDFARTLVGYILQEHNLEKASRHRAQAMKKIYQHLMP